MNVGASFVRAVWLCVLGGVVLLGSGACGGGDEGRRVVVEDVGRDADAVGDGEQDAESDVGEGDGAQDVEADGEGDASGPTWVAPPELVGTPIVGAIRVSSQDTVLQIDVEPFGFQVQGSGGERRVVAGGTGPRGLAVAVADPWSRDTYFDPTLRTSRPWGDDLTWYTLDRVLAAVETGQGYELIVAAEVEGRPGPWVKVRVWDAGTGVGMQIERSPEDRIVLTSVLVEAREGEGYYGLGELFDRLDSRGLIREMQIQVSGASETGSNEVHVGMPAYFSTEGYGFFTSDRHPSAFDFGATDANTTRWTTQGVSVVVRWMAVDSPLEFTERYTSVVGRPALVPFWALAPHYWRNENRDTEEVLDDARRAREAGVPASVVWIDRPWSSYYHNWRFNPSQFPDPAAMMAELRGLGYRVILHHSPQLNPPGRSDLGDDEDATEGLYAEAEARGWLVAYETGGVFQFPWGGGMGAFIDYSHPEAVMWVQGLIERVTALGAVGTKMDWDEYLQPNVGHVRLGLRFANGETNLTMRSWYSALYHRAIIEGFERGLGEPGFHVSRSGTPGDQVWNTCIWPGDLDNDLSEHGPGADGKLNVGGLPSAITANQALGLVGYPCFGSDIGGYRGGNPTEEVLLRWLAFGTFNGLMQLGGGGGSHMPWTADTRYSAEALEVTRRTFGLRMELLPTIYEGMVQAHRTGRPLVRSLYAEFPSDPETRRHERDFMFGSDLLVAPVFEAGVERRAVYLPAGAWLDFWSGEVVNGPGVVEREAPVGVIPVFVRQGATVQMAEPGIDTAFSTDAADIVSYEEVRNSRVLVWPTAERAVRRAYNGVGVGTTLEGDGTPVIALELSAADAALDPRWAFAPEAVTLMVVAAGTPFASGASSVMVSRGDATSGLPEQAGCGGECWWWDEASGRVMVRLTASGVVRVVPR